MVKKLFYKEYSCNIKNKKIAFKGKTGDSPRKDSEIKSKLKLRKKFPKSFVLKKNSIFYNIFLLKIIFIYKMNSKHHFILPNFTDALNSLHIFYNPFVKNNSQYDIFNSYNELCSICYGNIIIPSSIDSCKHKFCLCCILRWINKKNICPLCRNIINNVYYLDTEYDGKQITIQAKVFYRNEQNNLPKQYDSNYCIICNKNNNTNQLLLCPICKYNLTHLKCAGIRDSHISEFICTACKNLIK